MGDFDDPKRRASQLTVGWFARLYFENKNFKIFCLIGTNFALPILLQVLLALATSHGYVMRFSLPFTIIALAWLYSAWRVYVLEQKIPESKLEKELAYFKKQAELAADQIDSQLLKYESLKSIIETIHNSDIRTINKALKNQGDNIDAVLSYFDFERQLRYTIVQMAYYLNNFTEDGLFRVTFMEPRGNDLHLTHWSDWPDSKEIPEMRASSATLSKGEGCAGKAWMDGEAIFIPSIEQDQKGVKVFKMLDLSRWPKSKSIVSIPIEDRLHAPHEIVGILSIDSNNESYFTKPEDGDEFSHPAIEEIKHFFHLIIFYKRVHQLLVSFTSQNKPRTS